MSKKILGFLGVLIIVNPAFSALEQYFNFSISYGLITVIGLIVALNFLLLNSRGELMIRNISYFAYIYILFTIIIFISIVFTKTNILFYKSEFITRVIFPFFIMIIFYLVVKYLEFENYVKFSFVLNLLISGFVIIYHAITIDSGRPINVLGISDRLAFLGILMFGIEKNIIKKTFILITTFILLIMYSSFTSVIIFAIVVFLMLTYNFYMKGSKCRKTFIILTLIVISLVGLLVFMTVKNQKIELTTENYILKKVNYILHRLHNVLNQQDPSQVARQKLSEGGLLIIKDKPITGEFLYEVRIFGSTGAYIHNWFSYIAEFGIFVFFMIFAQYVRYMYSNYKLFKKNGDKISFALFFSAIYVLIVYVVSRSYSHSFLWISLAMLMTYSYNKKTTQVKIT